MARTLKEYEIEDILSALDDIECYLHDVKYLFEAINYDKVYGKKDATFHSSADYNAREIAYNNLDYIRKIIKD